MEKTYLDKLALVEIQERKILKNRTRGNDKWYMPGGKREKGETDQEALIREIKEELTIDIIPDSISYYGTFEAQAHGQPADMMVRVTCYTAQYSGELVASNEIEEFSWLNTADKDKITEIGKLIFEELKAKDLID
jgi:8-oxo-dGTP pyrophosphatase MutT (NUDIX family)